MAEEKINCADQKCKDETLEICKKYEADRGHLMAILNEAQEKFGYLPKMAQITIADYLNLPLAEVYGVITFYSRFTTKPKGKYNISICLGTACFVKGSQQILDRAKARLGVEEGEMTPDGKFSIDTVRCVGACGLAPVFIINGEVYGRATVKKFDEVLDEYMKKD